MKRSKAGILADILRVIANNPDGAMPTHILYKANLSYKLLKQYLDMLIESEFIMNTNVKGKKKYTITQKGHEFLQQFRKLERLSKAFGIEI
ncbi:MAG: DUF4364 family protein [Candidatus Aenigmatarchaeota archaeon]